MSFKEGIIRILILILALSRFVPGHAQENLSLNRTKLIGQWACQGETLPTVDATTGVLAK